MASSLTAENSQQQKLTSEGRREREFYRYYEPIKGWTTKGPACCDLGNEASARTHRPVPSPDSALTAFCQLGALRVGVRRAMLMLFDTSHAYILAEATRTLSLLDDSVQDATDRIWLGHSKIRGSHLSLYFMLSKDDLDRKIADDSLVHIINDLQEDPNLCGSYFVRSGPKARFYAGVSIRTKRGINIGTYCLLDDTPRFGLKESELKFLRHMASTVMDHLDMVRVKAQHQRATKMVAGIGQFVDGASDLGRGENEESANTLHSSTRKPRLRRDSCSKTTRESNTPSTSRPPADRKQSGESAESEGGSGQPGNLAAGSPTRNSPLETAASPGRAESGAESSRIDSSGGAKRASDLRAELVSSNVRKTFERAATVLRDAVNVDGAMFLDAGQSSYGGLIGNLVNASGQTNQSEHDSDASLSSTDESKGETERVQHTDSSHEGGPIRCCSILAANYRPNGGRIQPADLGTQINEKFLKKLLRRYPKGKIWNFSAQGPTSSDDDSKSDGGLSSASLTQDSLSRKKERQHSRLEDGKRISLHFPGVRSLAIAGIWNQESARWQAASVLWTYHESRYLTEDLDMPFLQAFSDVIMAEIHRIEAQKSDRAKVDFISSISHELRSPLHGILGSAEVIKEQGTDDLTTELVSQIEACGRTLLDIVDHLLDFSKINYYGRTAQKNLQSDSNNRQDQLSSAGKSSQLGSMMSLDTEVSLDVITEEVVDSAFYSFCCSQAKQRLIDRRVAIIMDIERGNDVNWLCRIALGGWKRILINLVSNALKYTAEGYIHVSLKRRISPRSKRKHNALLTVKDSGHGMSKAFLQDRLFSAFAQEDSFADGTGLGMNLVSTIVKAIGGRIEVQSEPDVGTSVVVQIPLEEAVFQENKNGGCEGLPELILPEGVTIAVPSVAGDTMGGTNNRSPIQATSRAIVVGSVVKTCDELGVQTITLGSGAQRADMLLIPEDLLFHFHLRAVADKDDGCAAQSAMSEHTRADTPLIILCDNEIRLRELRASRPELHTGRHVQLIRQPAGPDRISKAIRACLSAKGKGHNFGSQSDVDGARMTTQAHDFAGQSAAGDGSGVRPDAQANGGFHRINESAQATEEWKMAPRIPRPPDVTHNEKTSDPPSEGPNRALHPLTQQTSASDETSLSRAPANTGPKPTPALNRAESGMTLLLVDDNAINLQLLTTYAKKHGHLNIRAHNGQHAIDAYKAACTGLPLPPHLSAIQTTNDDRVQRCPQKPRVILMDINMPVLNGYEATQKIREFERSHGISPTTVVALTGLGSASAQQEAYSSGIDLFLTKPVKLKELSKILDGIDGEA